MLTIADDVFLLDGIPRCAINIYIAGDILIDAGTRHAERRIFRQIAGRTITAHALTHPHPDHQGASHAVCTRLGIPLWCGAIDADAMEQGDWYKLTPANSNLKLQHKFWTGPAHPVARRLRAQPRCTGSIRSMRMTHSRAKSSGRELSTRAAWSDLILDSTTATVCGYSFLR